MSCLNPILIPNNSRYLKFYDGLPLKRLVACNHCYECLKSKSLQMSFRLYWTLRETIDKGGFVYFDTLTYRECDVPHVSDLFPSISTDLDCYCFNRSHIRYFFVKLRRYLTSAGYPVAHNLKYFLVTEYGVDDRFTHRPHIHLLLFVNFPVNPVVFSRFIDKSWNFGKTDGVTYNPVSYVLQHNVIRDANFKVTNYIAKYMRKQSSYQSVIDKRINHLINNLDKDNMSSVDYSNEVKRIKRELDQFNLVSHGVGSYYENFVDLAELAQQPFVSLPVSDNVYTLQLPFYFKRRLFYSVVKDEFGDRHYELNNYGYLYANNSMERLYNAFRAQLLQMQDINFDVDDVARYAAYYRYRYYNGVVLDYLPRDIPLPNYSDLRDDHDFINYTSNHAFDYYQSRFYSPVDSGSKYGFVSNLKRVSPSSFIPVLNPDYEEILKRCYCDLLFLDFSKRQSDIALNEFKLKHNVNLTFTPFVTK